MNKMKLSSIPLLLMHGGEYLSARDNFGKDSIEAEEGSGQRTRKRISMWRGRGGTGQDQCWGLGEAGQGAPANQE